MKILSGKNIISTLLVVFVLKYFSQFFSIDFLDPIQNTLEDFQINDIVFSEMRNNDEVQIDSNIVLVNIGKLNRYGISVLINTINSYGPKIIAIDAFFRKPKNPEYDKALEQALSKVSNLVLVDELMNYDPKRQMFDTIHTSHPMFNKYASNGFANVVIGDEDFRTIRLFIPKAACNDGLVNSFPVTIAKLYAPGATTDLLKRENYTEILNYRRNTNKYNAINFTDIISGNCDLSLVTNKIVLMGYMGPDITSPTVEDMFFTSMNDRYVGKNYPDMYGTVVHANIISMILSKDYCYSVPYWLSLACAIFIFFCNMVFFSYLRDKHPSWYESLSLLIGFAQIFVIFLFILYSFYFFNVSIQNAGVFFGLVISKQAYEVWNDSLYWIFKDVFIKVKLT